MGTEDGGLRDRGSAPARRIRRGAEGWKALIAAQRASGQTVTAFCAERGVPRSSFGKWRQKLDAAPTKARSSAKRFLPVPIRAATPPTADTSPIELQLGAVRVRVSGAAASRLLDAIVARLAHSA